MRGAVARFGLPVSLVVIVVCAAATFAVLGSVIGAGKSGPSASGAAPQPRAVPNLAAGQKISRSESLPPASTTKHPRSAIDPLARQSKRLRRQARRQLARLRHTPLVIHRRPGAAPLPQQPAAQQKPGATPTTPKATTPKDTAPGQPEFNGGFQAPGG